MARKHGGRKPGDSGTKNGTGGRRRQNHAGTLERRGKRFLARWTSYTPEGKPVRMSKMLEADNIKDARKELDALTGTAGLMSAENDLRRTREKLEGIHAELERIEDEKPALSLADMFAEFKASPEKKFLKKRRDDTSPATMRQYEIQAGRFVSWVAEHYPEAKEMRHISHDVALAYVKDLGKTVSGNSFNKYLSLLNLIWRTLGERAKCKSNPWDGINRMGQNKETGRRVLTSGEMARVLRSLTGEMRTLFILGTWTGLRLGDCALMEWGNIDLANGWIIVTPRKTKNHGEHAKEIPIPIQPELYAVLDETPEDKRSGFLTPKIAKMYKHDRSALTDRIQRAFRAAGIKTSEEVEGYARKVVRVGFHSLRHGLVSGLGNAGASLALVQSIVGHSNPYMTSRYFHAQRGAIKDAFDKLPDHKSEPQTVDAESRYVDNQQDTRDARLAALDAALDAILEHGDADEIEAAVVRAKRLGEARGAGK